MQKNFQKVRRVGACYAMIVMVCHAVVRTQLHPNDKFQRTIVKLQTINFRRQETAPSGKLGHIIYLNKSATNHKGKHSSVRDFYEEISNDHYSFVLLKEQLILFTINFVRGADHGFALASIARRLQGELSFPCPAHV